MIYAYRIVLNGVVTTLVVAGSTQEEYENYIVDISTRDPKVNFIDNRVTDGMMDHMDPPFDDFSKPVLVIEHDSELQQDDFFKEEDIEEVQSMLAIDKQKDMVHQEEYKEQTKAEDREKMTASILGEKHVGKSIEEIYGLDENDPWDKRSAEDKEAEKFGINHMKELQDQDLMTSEPLMGDANSIRKAREKARMESDPDYTPKEKTTVLGASYEDDPESVNLTELVLHKKNYAVDEDQKKKNLEKSKKELEDALGDNDFFDPEDFAAILAGNGSSSVTGQKATRGEIEEPELSDKAKNAIKLIEEEKERAAQEEKIKAQDEKYASQLEDHQKGKFTSYIGTECYRILVEDLPVLFKKKIKEDFDKFSKIKGVEERKNIPVYEYSPSSILNGYYLIPMDSKHNDYGNRIVASRNVEVEETINIAGSQTILVKKDNQNKEALILCASPIDYQVKDPDFDNATKYVNGRLNFYIIKIR